MKILWTFDPFQENKELVHVGKKLLKSYFPKDDISAVYVASLAENELNYAYDVPKEERYTTYPKSLIQKALKKMGMEKVNTEVIPLHSLSLSSITKTLVDFSASNRFDLVVIASNAKAMLPRLILGSFAESFIHLSKTDLLVFHQKTEFEAKMPKKILYAHDFSTKSQKGLERVIQYAKHWKAHLDILHVNMPTVDDENQNNDLIIKKIQKLSFDLKAQDISFDFILLENKRLIEELIIKTAKKVNADVISLTNQADKLDVLLGGSTTRHVLRNAKLPLLILKVK